jgi:hypothetical protein
MTTLGKAIALIVLWLSFGLLLFMIWYLAELKAATAIFAGLASFCYWILLSVLFFGKERR